MQPGKRTLPARAILPSIHGLCAFGPDLKPKDACRARFQRGQSTSKNMVFARLAQVLNRTTRQPGAKR